MHEGPSLPRPSYSPVVRRTDLHDRAAFVFHVVVDPVLDDRGTATFDRLSFFRRHGLVVVDHAHLADLLAAPDDLSRN
jgi:hypothetical protein